MPQFNHVKVKEKSSNNTRTTEMDAVENTVKKNIKCVGCLVISTNIILMLIIDI